MVCPPSPAPDEREHPPERVGELIAHRRRVLDWSLARLAREVGCARSYLSELEHGRRSASEEILARIEAAMGMPAGSLVEAARWERALGTGGATVAREVSRLREQSDAACRLVDLLRSHAGSLDDAYRSGALASLIARVSPSSHGEEVTSDAWGRGGESGGKSGEASGGAASGLTAMLPREVPLINSVAAGYPRGFTDLSYPARFADDYIRCPGIADPDAFAARVVGDSMEPDYREGDIVVFSPNKPIKDGDDCFARLEPDSDATFKRVYFEQDASGTEWIRLQPANSKYPPRTLPREDVAGLYPAVTAIRRIG